VTSNYYGGNHVTQHGDHNTGMVNNVQAGPQATLQEMVRLAEVLRGRVDPVDRQVIDDSLREIGSGAGADKGAFRRALGGLAGVAAVVGEVGAPVVEAVRKVTAAFGL
jgi:hypothetical protein